MKGLSINEGQRRPTKAASPTLGIHWLRLAVRWRRSLRPLLSCWMPSFHFRDGPGVGTHYILCVCVCVCGRSLSITSLNDQLRAVSVTGVSFVYWLSCGRDSMRDAGTQRRRPSIAIFVVDVDVVVVVPFVRGRRTKTLNPPPLKWENGTYTSA